MMRRQEGPYPTTAGNQFRTREERTSTPPLLRFLGSFSRLWALRSQAQRPRTRLTAASGWGAVECCSFVVGRIQGRNLNGGRGKLQVEKESWSGATKVKDHTHPGGGRGSGAKSGKIGIGSQGKETTGQANALTMFGQLVCVCVVVKDVVEGALPAEQFHGTPSCWLPPSCPDGPQAVLDARSISIDTHLPSVSVSAEKH